MNERHWHCGLAPGSPGEEMQARIEEMYERQDIEAARARVAPAPIKENDMAELNELAAALAAAQGEIEPAPKDSDNPFYKSKYASLPAVRQAVRAAFARHGLSVVQMPEVHDGKLCLRTLLLHASGQSLDCGVLSADVDLANPQKIGSAITYFRRYALAAISQTVADDDDDANANVAPPAKQAQAKPAPKVKPTDDEQAYITDALGEITRATSGDELAMLGEIIKGKSATVKSALRGAYEAQMRHLRTTEKDDAQGEL